MSLKSKMTIKLNTKGLDNVKRRVKSMPKYISKTGFWDGMSADGEMSIASLAFLQEYGRPQTAIHNGIPARAFFRASTINVKNGRSDVRRQMKYAMKMILDGTQTTPESLRQVGRIFEEEVKTIITYFDEPSNASRTVAIKGKDDPLVHTSHMRNSVKNKVVKRGSNV